MLVSAIHCVLALLAVAIVSVPNQAGAVGDRHHDSAVGHRIGAGHFNDGASRRRLVPAEGPGKRQVKGEDPNREKDDFDTAMPSAAKIIKGGVLIVGESGDLSKGSKSPTRKNARDLKGSKHGSKRPSKGSPGRNLKGSSSSSKTENSKAPAHVRVLSRHDGQSKGPTSSDRDSSKSIKGKPGSMKSDTGSMRVRTLKGLSSSSKDEIRQSKGPQHYRGLKGGAQSGGSSSKRPSLVRNLKGSKREQEESSKDPVKRTLKGHEKSNDSSSKGPTARGRNLKGSSSKGSAQASKSPAQHRRGLKGSSSTSKADDRSKGPAQRGLKGSSEVGNAGSKSKHGFVSKGPRMLKGIKGNVGDSKAPGRHGRN